MDFPQQRGVHFPGNAPPAAGTPGTAAFQASQHPRSAPSSYHHPVPGRPRGYADVVQDAVVSDWHCDVPLFMRIHMPVLFSVPAGECCR